MMLIRDKTDISMGTDPIKTGIFAARMAIPKYLNGLTFILSLSGTATLVVPVLDTLPLNQALVMIISRFQFFFLAIFYLNAAVDHFRSRIRSGVGLFPQ
jgi:hypothetical protein